MELSTHISEFEKPLPDPKPFFEKADALYQEMISTKKGRVIFVVGELGRGKTSLMRSILDHFQQIEPSCNVIDGRFIDGKYEPYLPKRDFDVVQTADTVGNIAATLSEFIPTHYKAFFSLGGQILQAVASKADFLKAHSLKQPAMPETPYWLLQILREAVKGKPLVCVIDDFDEAQEAFVWNNFLDSLAHEIAVELPILFFVSISGKEDVGEHEDKESRLEYLTRKLVRKKDLADWWYIKPLSTEEISDWINLKTDLGIVSQLHGVTSGNPFWVRTLWEEWRVKENVVFNEYHQIWQWSKDNKPQLNQLKDSFKNQIKMLLKTSDDSKVDEAIEILGLAALEGRTFTLDVLALALNRDTEEIEDYLDDYFLKHSDNPNGILLVAKPLLLDTEALNAGGYSRYKFALDWHWHILHKYIFPSDSEKYKNVQIMIQALKIFFESNERQTASELVRLYKIIKDKDFAHYYQQIADYYMHRVVMRGYALAILKINIQVLDETRCRDLGKFLYNAGVEIYGANPMEDLVIFNKVLELAKKAKDSETQGFCLYRIGVINCKIGDIKVAKENADKAQNLVSKIKNRLFDSHINSLFGDIYKTQGRYKEAEPYYKNALKVSKKVLGENYLDTAASYSSLANLYRLQGRYQESEHYYKKALDIHEKVLGENHTHTATSYNNLAVIYESQERYEEAEPYYNKALKIRKKVLGENHPDTATSYNNLVVVYELQGRFEEAETYYEKALEIRKKVLGENHPDTATSYNNLAFLYLYQKRYEESELYYLKSLEIRKKILGEHHPDTALSYSTLGGLRFKQEKYQEALDLCENALEIFQKTLRENHSYIQICKQWITDIKEAMGK